MHALICGSLAFDIIMVFDGHFKDHILPERIHAINVAFTVPSMRREFGGCAGNIAYGVKLLGGLPLIMTTVGDDFPPYYAAHLRTWGIPQTYIKTIPNTFTAQAFITTDRDDNQITAFHPGAMGVSHKTSVLSAVNKESISLGIVAPDSHDGMLQHAREFREAKVPFIFDPGQAMTLFTGEELFECIQLATYVAVNDYECSLLVEKTGKPLTELISEVEAFIVTKGSEGAVIYTNNREINVPCASAEALIDPTGCGDAFRAGLIYGIQNRFDWETTGRLAALMGAIKIEKRGGQNYYFTREQFASRYEAEFGTTLNW